MVKILKMPKAMKQGRLGLNLLSSKILSSEKILKNFLENLQKILCNISELKNIQEKFFEEFLGL